MNNQEIEIEFKNLLTFEEFTALCSHFNVNSEDFFSQENLYFDTPSFSLKEKRCALRIRQKGDEFTLTLKQPAAKGLLETHQKISKEEKRIMCHEAQGIPNGLIADILEKEFQIDPTSVTYFGSLQTNRVEFSYQNGLLVLDESHYLETSDFELEYEVSNYEEGEKHFLNLLKENNIPIRETKNKIARFYDRKICRLNEKEGE
ncbi:CYTH domain-containing protein [Sutcliffiella deserti]|uniref:CYTH domain-containing protein n=1 Tax=Sutcliffiella deserti TaxID=2875501 RepID=UPI001CBFF370|nr:CYTH domain-containing protein [Sutcliffiella deserti]